MKIFGTKRNAVHMAKKRGRARKVILILLILALLVTGGVYAFLTFFIREPVIPPVVIPPRDPPEINNRDPVYPEDPPPDETVTIHTVLIAGQDDVGEFGLSDTVMLVGFDRTNNRVNVINIPRDLKVDEPWAGSKINTIINMTRSVDRLMDAAEAMIGFRPGNYVVLDMQAFADLVDVIEGFYFDVPRRMLYDDPYQNLHIDLQPGHQLLNGTQALHVARWRKNNDGSGYFDGDLGRIATQQALMGALASELLQIRNVTRVREIARIFSERVRTDLGLGHLLWFAMRLMDVDREDIHFLTIPNYEARIRGLDYQVIVLEEWLEMINAYLNPHPFEVWEENLRVHAWKNGSVQLVGEGRSLTSEFEWGNLDVEVSEER